MAMSVGGDSSEDKPLSEINTTPLVDVMLVLLIVFLITAPVVAQTIPLKLPSVVFDPTVTKPENVLLQIRETDGKCEVHWGMTQVSHQELLDRAVAKLKGVVDRLGANLKPDDLPEVHIRGDVDSSYRCIGGAVYTMQMAGFAKVGFISQPEAGSIPIVRD